MTLTFGGVILLQARQQAQSIGISEFLEIPVTVESYQKVLILSILTIICPLVLIFYFNNIICQDYQTMGLDFFTVEKVLMSYFKVMKLIKKYLICLTFPWLIFSLFKNRQCGGTPQYYSKLDDEYINRYLIDMQFRLHLIFRFLLDHFAASEHWQSLL